MRSKRILSIVLLIAIVILRPAISFAQQGARPYKDMATEILKYVNEHRRGMGLKPLRMNGLITAASTTHSRDMAMKKIPFGHEGFNERMEKLSKELKPAYSFAENVGMGKLNAREAVDMWLNSPGHRKNIEGDYNLTGIGIVKSTNGDLYFTEIFINRGN